VRGGGKLTRTGSLQITPYIKEIYIIQLIKTKVCVFVGQRPRQSDMMPSKPRGRGGV
jgi:hypothetical protein